ncbi:TPA: type IV secretion system protein VirB2 [Pseudomonas aeruginosa]|nr:type IV secretion system protein VirB2 [Pseudomonas aeruginosa]HBP4890789.1 type IV secretion system protein VirB2 [Pseudomonas aeruginosa]
MRTLRNKGRERLLRLAVFLAVYTPLIAMADEWDQKAVQLARNIRLGMFAIGGSLALLSLLWVGIGWMIARANGDHSKTFMDYVNQVIVIAAVGAALILGAWAWAYFGGGTVT